MNNSPLSPEQKLDEIYRLLLEQESRRKRALWWGIVKRIFIYGGIIFMIFQGPFIIQKLTEMLKPIVMEQAKIMMQENKDGLMNQVQDLLPKE